MFCLDEGESCVRNPDNETENSENNQEIVDLQEINEAFNSNQIPSQRDNFQNVSINISINFWSA